VGRVPAPRRRRNHNFDLNPKRRKEIVQHALLVGAMDTEDRSRWLIAWHWHNRKAKDPIWSLMEAAKRMGGKITEAEASAITEEASRTPKHLKADNLARFLGVTYAQRKILGIRTIGSVDVKKRARRVLRQRKDRLYREGRRRANGVQDRLEYEANSIAAKARAEGVSRMTIYRRIRAEQAKNHPDVTGVSAISFLTSEDRPVTPAGVEGLSEPGFASKEARGLPSSQTATTMAADRYELLPAELRMAVLCLPIPENLARAKIGVAA
jgi:hypothetical protein